MSRGLSRSNCKNARSNCRGFAARMKDKYAGAEIIGIVAMRFVTVGCGEFSRRLGCEITPSGVKTEITGPCEITPSGVKSQAPAKSHTPA